MFKGIKDYFLQKRILKMLNFLEKIDYPTVKYGLLKLKWSALKNGDKDSYDAAEAYYDCIVRLEKFYNK